MRLLRSNEAGDRLGVSRFVVRSLLKYGVLEDKKPLVPGARKHYAGIDPADIRRLKAARIKARGKITAAVAAQILLELGGATTSTNGNGNGHAPIAVAPKPVVTVAEPANGIVTRLVRIEEKLDRLLKIWQ